MKIGYRDNALYLKLDDSIPLEILTGTLVAWHKIPKQDWLKADAVLFALNEARDLIPDLKLGASIYDFLTEVSAANYCPEDPAIPGLKPVQQKPTFILKNRQRAILTATPGLGKSVMTAKALALSPPALTVIVCPKTIIDDWVTHLGVWWFADDQAEGFTHKLYVWPDRHAVGEIDLHLATHTVVVTTHDVISGLYKRDQLDLFFPDGGPNSTLVLDESFLYKNRKALRSEPAMMLANLFERVWLLSGMPIAKFSDDIFMQLKVLYPKVFTSYWEFARRYCFTDKQVWGEKVIEDRPHAQAKLKADLADIIIECEYPENIPDWQPVVIDVPMTPNQEQIYTQLAKQKRVEARLLGRTKDLTLKNIITLTGRLLQIASNPLLIDGPNESGKWSKLLELLAVEALPVLIWVNYTETANQIAQMIASCLPYFTVALLNGETKPEDRKRIKQQFQAGELTALIIHPGVGKYGLTLTAAKTVIYLEKGWDREANYQTLYRARRINSDHSVKMIHLLSTHANGKPTLDHLVHKKLNASSANAMRLTTGEIIGSL